MQVGDVVYTIHGRQKDIQTTPIVGETSRSWLVSDIKIDPSEVHPKHWAVTKISKKELAAGTLYGIWATKEQAEDFKWFDANRYHISSDVGRLNEVKILRQIANLIGYIDGTS